MKNQILLIVGPTAVGKTGLSLILAKKIAKVEIISADSRQVYKYMNIGTAKPTPEQLALVPHHFIDIKYPDEYYSAGKYGREARQTIDRLLDEKKIPIVVGGSGLYIRALVDGFFEKQIFDPQVKARLKDEFKSQGLEVLYERLKQVDPISAEKLHPNDKHRIVRALEVYELTGEPLSAFQSQGNQKANFEPIFIGLTRDRSHLYQMIEQRVDLMLEQGLIEEVIQLRAMGYHSKLNSMQTVGYREVFEYLDQKINFDEMVRLIKQRSRNYAKRQMTWFRKDERIRWFDVDHCRDLENLCNEITAAFQSPKSSSSTIF
jgi:tRNA dimethylallyltransferase